MYGHSSASECCCARCEEHYRPILRRLRRGTRAWHGGQRGAEPQATGTPRPKNCRNEARAEGKSPAKNSRKPGRRMIPAQTIDASGMLLLLVNAALRTHALAAVAGLGLAVFRVRPPPPACSPGLRFCAPPCRFPFCYGAPAIHYCSAAVLPQTAVLPSSSVVVVRKLSLRPPRHFKSRNLQNNPSQPKGKTLARAGARIPGIAGQQSSEKSIAVRIGASRGHRCNISCGCVGSVVALPDWPCGHEAAGQDRKN